MKQHDLSSLRYLFLAGEPLDEPTARWIADGARRADHRQLLADRDRLADSVARSPASKTTPRKFGSPSFPLYGYDVKLLDETHRRGRRAPTRRACVTIAPPLPPGCMTDRLGRRRALRARPISRRFPDSSVYSTFDWGIRDEDGYYFILGRTDDVINVAGHRLGTREIEEAVQAHPASPKSPSSASPIR